MHCEIAESIDRSYQPSAGPVCSHAQQLQLYYLEAGLVVHCFFVVNPAPGSENDRWLGSGSGRAEAPAGPVGFGSGIRR